MQIDVRREERNYSCPWKGKKYEYKQSKQKALQAHFLDRARLASAVEKKEKSERSYSAESCFSTLLPVNADADAAREILPH